MEKDPWRQQEKERKREREREREQKDRDDGEANLEGITWNCLPKCFVGERERRRGRSCKDHKELAQARKARADGDVSESRSRIGWSTTTTEPFPASPPRPSSARPH
ncbi:hypothetical protein BHE74_00048192 [Ensete ventricosum]|nr:hypothetical protein GW17_00007703 [Ensete ventricosum]RWW45925.1 hypothetical protein BHE74_00048192 [Ensete ventricosum]